MKFFLRTVDRISQTFGAISMVLLAAAVLVVCQMIFIRYALNASTVWQTEFVIYSIMASTFLGSPYVLLHRGHVGVDLLPTMLGGSGRFILEMIGGLISLAFCIVLAYSGWIYFHEAWEGGWSTDTVWALPLWIPLLPLPLGIGMLCLQYVAELIKLTQGQSLSASELSTVREEL
ncbi:MAG: TRAP transporter small permease [Alphaproteobacteria bacterium]|nr:TRAP transporter small permease [Alphaproteobacteria bacterium]